MMRIPAIVFVTLAFTFGAVAPEAQSKPNGIAVEQAWARATPNSARTGAAYLTLVNRGTVDEKLVSGSTPVAETVQFHSDTNENGVMKMRQETAIDVKPGASVTFAPGHLHVMMIGLHQPLKEGESFPLTLEFADGSSVAVAVPVQKIGAMKPGGMGGMQH